MDWQTGFTIDAVAGFDHVVLHVAANAVLWTKQRAQIDVWMIVKKIGGVMKVVIDGCLIADQPGASAFQQYLAARLIDEVNLSVVPLFLKAGERLFDHLGSADLRLEQVRVIAAPGVTHIKYRAVK